GNNAFVTKLNPLGSALVYSTYLGGDNDDQGLGIAVDAAGNAYVVGQTASSTFPTTPGAFQRFEGGGLYDPDAFVTKLNPLGSAVVYSTYLGGDNDDQGLGIAVDAAGNAYVVGQTASSTFPTTPGAFQRFEGGGLYEPDAFVTKLNPLGSAFVYSTYLGGISSDQATGLALDGARNPHVSGDGNTVTSATTPGPRRATRGGATDATRIPCAT